MNNQDPFQNLTHEHLVEELGLKNKNEQELFAGIMEAGKDWSDEEKRMVEAAYDLARKLHIDDTHKDKPYVYHLLRNASRATGYLGITDPEIITAIILHDAVEDHPVEIMQVSFFGDKQAPTAMPIPEDPNARQQLALKHLSVLFSEKVASMVAAVTNPPSSETASLTYEEKLAKYAEKVQKAVETPEGWIIKFVDWVDNGLGIIHSEEPSDSDNIRHFSRKYGMVAPIFAKRYVQPDIQKMLSPAAKRYVESQLGLANVRLDIEK